eukprot:7242604-Pyramimonas_sp.AAC.1
MSVSSSADAPLGLLWPKCPHVRLQAQIALPPPFPRRRGADWKTALQQQKSQPAANFRACPLLHLHLQTGQRSRPRSCAASGGAPSAECGLPQRHRPSSWHRGKEA